MNDRRGTDRSHMIEYIYAWIFTPYAVYLIERCLLIAFKLTTRLKRKGTPTKAFGTCGKYCFRSINDVRVGGAGP